MNRPGSVPYASSKAALEMTTEIWAKELAGTGVTVNIVNPGAGANTPGMAQEMRDWSKAGTKPRLVEPDEMAPPLPFVVSPEADNVNGYRFDALTGVRSDGADVLGVHPTPSPTIGHPTPHPGSKTHAGKCRGPDQADLFRIETELHLDHGQRVGNDNDIERVEQEARGCHADDEDQGPV
jgi:NAD(P)-dependent dehydrogenase (short-subunit alcohol dehydrogenase family)